MRWTTRLDLTRAELPGDVKEDETVDVYRDQTMKGLECQVNMSRLHLEDDWEPREDSEQGKDLVRSRFRGAFRVPEGRS